MIKSSFSRTATKLPPPCSSKKPSLASLAQKLQDIDFSSTSHAECTLPVDSQSIASVPFSSTDGILTSGLHYTRTSVPENEVGVDQVVCLTSQPVSGCDNVDSVCFDESCSSEVDDDFCSSGTRSKTALSSLSRSQNDCSVAFNRLHINAVPQKICRSVKPTPFGRTLSAVPVSSVRGIRKHRKVALYPRLSYFRQMAAVAGTLQHPRSVNSQTIKPFDFSTPSPDDIVREKQKQAFSPSTK